MVRQEPAAPPAIQDTARSYRRLPSLTGLRFVAAAMVFVSHAPTLHVFADERIDDQFARFGPPLGNAGVEFFFVLSGFVLTWSARPTDSTRSFWWRRIVKIYPNNVVACALALVGIVATGNAVVASTTLSNLFLVQDWWPDVPLNGGLNRPSWSLACEVLFYLMFPLLLPLLRRVPDRLLWSVAGIVVAIIVLVPTIAMLLPAHPAFEPGLSYPQYWFIYVFPVSRLLEFVLGIMVARLVLAGRWIGPGFAVAALIAVGALALTEFAPRPYALVATMIVPLALVIGAGATADTRGTPSPVRGRAMVWLGEASYAFYMLHFLVLMYGHLIVRHHRWDWPVGVGVLLAFFAASVGLAALLYVSVERPLVRRARKSVTPTIARN